MPAKLGYELVEERTKEPTAPGETGVDCVWATTRDQWLASRDRRLTPPRSLDGILRGCRTRGPTLDRATEYLARADSLPHRGEGEGVLVRDLAQALPGRILDLGCGDGRLTALALAAYPESTATCVDMSEPMLAAAADRFDGDARVTFTTHDLDDPLPFDGPFDAVVTSLAVHHVDDERKRALYAEIAALLAPGGVFANLEIVDEPDPGAARPVARRDGRPRRPERHPARHDEPARLDRRGRARRTSTASGSGAASPCSAANDPLT